MFNLLIALSICLAVWLLTGSEGTRIYGSFAGLLCSLLWIFAGMTGEVYGVALVAAFCGGRFSFVIAREQIAVRRSGGRHAS
jgi:hypothetical protein